MGGGGGSLLPLLFNRREEGPHGHINVARLECGFSGGGGNVFPGIIIIFTLLLLPSPFPRSRWS